MKSFLDILKGLKISNTIFLDSAEKFLLINLYCPSLPPTNKNLATALGWMIKIMFEVMQYFNLNHSLGDISGEKLKLKELLGTLTHVRRKNKERWNQINGHSALFYFRGDLIGSMNEPIKMSERNLNVLINAKDFSV